MGVPSHLRIADAARRDLVAFSAHTTGVRGWAKAPQYFQHLKGMFRSLLEHPGLGVARIDPGRWVRSIGSGAHVVFYSDHGEIIEVLRVLHGAMDVEEVVRDESERAPRRQPKRQR